MCSKFPALFAIRFQKMSSTSPAGQKLSNTLSERIAVARVLCIFGMIYVHVPALDSDYVVYAFDLGAPFESLRAFLIEGFGRASASLLSLISGYLSARVLLRATTSRRVFIQRKFSSIFVPMVIWGALTLLIYAVVSLVRPTFLTDEGPNHWSVLLHFLNTVFFLTDTPVGPTMHLSFLRDLFVCMLLAPWLLRALRWSAAVTLGACLMFYLLDIETVIILRPLILLGYVVGLWLFAAAINVEAADRYWWLWSALAVASTLLLMLFNAGSFAGLDAFFQQYGLSAKESLLYPVCRLFGSLALWTLTLLIVRTWAGARLAAVAPYAFITYCSHFIVLSLLFFVVWQPLLNGGEGLLFMLWFLAGPAVAFFAGWLMVQLLAPLVPQFVAILTGGRTMQSIFSRTPVAGSTATSDSPGRVR